LRISLHIHGVKEVKLRSQSQRRGKEQCKESDVSSAMNWATNLVIVPDANLSISLSKNLKEIMRSITQLKRIATVKWLRKMVRKWYVL
jgi:hypothetical protein